MGKKRNSVEAVSPLVSEHVIPSGNKRRRRAGIVLPIAVLITTLVTLCCMIFQLKMFLLYMDLKQQSSHNSFIIAEYEKLQQTTTQNSQNKTTQSEGRNTVDHAPQNTQNMGEQNHTELDRQRRFASVVSDVGDVVQHTTSGDSKRLANGFPFYRFGQIGDYVEVDKNQEAESPVQQRRKRSDEADIDARNGNRRRGSNRNDDTPRRARQDGNQSVKVMHLELHKDPGRQLSVDQGEFITSWRTSDEFEDHDFADNLDRSISINQRGVYLIYSQITFEDRYGRWSYSITINNQPFIKCLSTEWGIEKDPEGVPVTTYGQCHTAAVRHLNVGDAVRVKSMYRTDNIHTDTDLTFWGFVKLS